MNAFKVAVGGVKNKIYAYTSVGIEKLFDRSLVYMCNSFMVNTAGFNMIS